MVSKINYGESNDDLRQRFIDMTVKQAEVLGITIPDPDLKWNEERGHYDFGKINWDELNDVIKGNGPCNEKTMEARIIAHEEGKWVVEAAKVYADKKSKVASVEAA